MNIQTITIKEYLIQKGIEFKEVGSELITKCLFGNCDQDSRTNEAHLYFSMETGQYQCKKCGAEGNIITLAKHFGEDVKDVATPNNTKPKNPRKSTKFDPEIAERCHQALPDRIKQYLNGRGLTDATIDHYKLGYCKIYGKSWITIPIADKSGVFKFMKLRRDPIEDATNPDKYKFWPTGNSAEIYGWEMLINGDDEMFLCEGEFDRLVIQENGIPAITSTAGAGTFKKEWIEEMKHLEKIYICYDKDEQGEKGTEKVIGLLKENLPDLSIYKITLPEMDEGNDITDYFMKHNGNIQELMDSAKWVAGREPIDTSKFQPLTSEELIKTLGLTIKKDNENKLVCFLCQLSAYTESCQFNVSFNAPSSTGKSFIPIEVARLFPEKDVIELGYVSPTAFFHDVGKLDKEKGGYVVDLSRKILIFLDQPHTMLLERLRPLLSHDKKEMKLKITDKSQKGGLRTKTVIVNGFPAVVFCSAGLKFDEQEGTRFLLLSPETDQEKLREGIIAKIVKESDKTAYNAWLNSNPDRKLLRERIRAIRNEKIDNIKIPEPEKIEEIFLANKKILKPKHQRDIGRFLDVVKAFTLLNVWFRERIEKDIVANDDDIREAVKVWEKISESQEHGIPPYIYNLFNDIIIPAYQDKNREKPAEIVCEGVGITRKEVMKKHREVYGRMLGEWHLRSQILPMLENCGLITQEQDPDDKRKMLIFPNIE